MMTRPAAFLLLSFILAAAGCNDQPESPPHDASAAREVSTASAVEMAVPARAFAGTVTSVREIAVSSRLGAHVREVRVREGDLVRAKEVLVSLDDADVRSLLVQAESDAAAAGLALRDAETDFGKFSELYREEAASEAEMRKARLLRDQARQLLRAAEARLAQARERLNDAVVRAPEDARVFSVRAEPGMLSAPGVPLVLLESLEGLLFEIHVPASVLAAVRPGDRAVVTLDGMPDPIEAVVLRSVQSADRLSRTGVVKIELPAGTQALPGGFGRAELPGTADGTGTWVEERHLAERGGLSGVFVVRDGRACFQWLRLGRRNAAGMVEVLAGLGTAETIVAEPPAGLYDGDRVSVAKEAGR